MLRGGVRFIDIHVEAGVGMGAASCWLLEVAAAVATCGKTDPGSQ